LKNLTIKVEEKSLGNWAFGELGKSLEKLPDINPLLNIFLTLALKLTDMEAGDICFQEGSRLTKKMEFNLGRESSLVPKARLKSSLIGWDKNLGSFLSTPNAHCELEIAYEKRNLLEDIQQYIGVPIGKNDKFLGVLNLYSWKKREIARENLKSLNLLASQIASITELVKTLNQEKELGRQAQISQQTAKNLGQSTSLEEIYQYGLKALVDLTGMDRCLILLYDEKRRELRFTFALGISPEQKEFFSYFSLPASGIEENLWKNLQSGKPIVLPGIPPLSPALEEFFKLLPTNSCLLAPLVSKNKFIGLIYLDDSRTHYHFNSTKIKNIMGLIIQIATAIQRINETVELGRCYYQQEALYHVALSVSGSLSLPKVYQIITDKAQQLLGGAPIALQVWDEGEKNFSLQSSVSLEENSLDLEILSLLAKFSAKRKRPLSFNRGDKISGHSLEDMFFRLESGGVLVVPLIFKKKVLGVLHCFAKIGKKFNPEEFSLLRRFAIHSAQAIQNARTYLNSKNKVRELAILFEVGKSISSILDLKKVLSRIVEKIKNFVQADACSIMLLDHDTNKLKVESANGLSKHYLDHSISQPDHPLLQAMHTGMPVLLSDSGTKAARFPAIIREEGFKTMLGVPLSVRGRNLGFLNLYKKENYKFDEWETNLLVSLGHQAALAIENARLYEEQVRMGKLLQDTLTPKEEFSFPGLEVEHIYIPSEQLSGDYYDLIPLNDHQVAITIADVSGKGHQAAMYTVRAKYLLRALAKSGYAPGSLLQLMNRLIYVDTEVEKFISLFYGILDLEKNELLYACAGHDPPIYLKFQTDKIFQLRAKGILIGVTPEADFEEKTLTLNQGDSLVLYTDGLVEARSPQGELFGVERALQVVKSSPNLGPKALGHKLYNTVQKYTRKKIFDDLSLMIIKINDRPQVVTD